jgi:hypothetical protein
MNASDEERAPAARPRIKLWRVGLIVSVALSAAGVIAWQNGVFAFLQGPRLSDNSLMVIAPYRYQGTWVFDDDRVGLVREPFVGGVPEMIDVLVDDIPNADEGFRLTFSAKPFPGHERKLTWVREASGGNYYALEDPPMEGWICPALFRYYRNAPKEIYVKADPIL